METSLDLSQTSIVLELTFLDLDPGSKHESLDNTGWAIHYQTSNHLSLRLGDSQSGEEGPGAPGVREETSGQQDGVNKPEGAYAEVVLGGSFSVRYSDS